MGFSIKSTNKNLGLYFKRSHLTIASWRKKDPRIYKALRDYFEKHARPEDFKIKEKDK